MALGLLEDVQAFPQTAEGGSGCGFEQQEVLVQTGQRASGGKGVNGVDQVLLLALCLGHHLGTRNGNVEISLPGFSRFYSSYLLPNHLNTNVPRVQRGLSSGDSESTVG